MKCEDVQAQLIDLLYLEPGAPPAVLDVREHVESCASCRKELQDLERVQGALRAWPEEPPLRPIAVPKAKANLGFRVPVWSLARYAAVAALMIVAFLGLANARFSWDQNGFSFKTTLYSGSQSDDYYTKEQVHAILERVINYNERSNYQMMQKMLDTIDQERANDYRNLFRQIKEGGVRN